MKIVIKSFNFFIIIPEFLFYVISPVTNCAKFSSCQTSPLARRIYHIYFLKHAIKIKKTPNSEVRII